MAQPPMKKQKTMDANVQLESLRKVRCNLPEEVSPGSLHGCRLALWVSQAETKILVGSCGCQHIEPYQRQLQML